MPDGSYVASLFRDGKDRMIQKVGEEGTEVVIAAKNTDKRRQVEEITDLVFHTFILMVQLGITIQDIEKELDKRSKERS
jgi:phosphoribosyl-ATP pyrophosphohydrolase